VCAHQIACFGAHVRAQPSVHCANFAHVTSAQCALDLAFFLRQRSQCAALLSALVGARAIPSQRGALGPQSPGFDTFGSFRGQWIVVSGRISRRNPAKTGVFPMTRADSASVPIPPGSPLAIGWRAKVVALLARYGPHEIMDVISAYAELCVQADPDNCSAAEESAQGSWFKLADPAFRRIDGVAGLKAARDKAMLAATRMPLPSRIRGGGKKSLRPRRRAVVVA
jgi:hypothetical protein